MKGGSWSINTFLRVRPNHVHHHDLLQYDIQGCNLHILNFMSVIVFISEVELVNEKSSRSIFDLDIPNDADPGLVHNNGLSGKLRFEFDRIFDVSSTQEQVFNLVARSKILDALDGINCTIFAYGQTGSGKSYTIFGGDTYAERGLIPRSIGLVFEEIRSRQTKQISFAFKCQISFTEVYKENVFDLLDQENRSQGMDNWSTVQVMEGENGIVIRNLNVFEVSSEEEALQLFFMGNTNRITESTSMNNVSSRSHAIFTLILESEGIKDGKTIFSCGKINLVDLAGSERMYKVRGVLICF
jgi:kinesin family protein 6/9